jgi:hypothetical protein
VTSRRRTSIGVLALALVAAGAPAATAQVFDLTGSWEGTRTCKGLEAGAKTRIRADVTVAISQSGNAVGVRVDEGGAVAHFTGLANPDGKKPLTKGELALIRCGTDDVPGLGEPRGALAGATDELGRFLAATKAPPNPKATVKGTTVFAADEGLGTCAWRWKRTALADPGVPTGCLQ